MKREFIMRKPCVILATLFCNNVNAEWGQEWGSMVWGQSSANAPMMGGFGQLIFFGLLLVIGVFVTKRWGLIKTFPAIAMLSLMPLMVDADEIELNTFQNGHVADADDVNENFTNLKSAIQASAPTITYYEETFNTKSMCWTGYYFNGSIQYGAGSCSNSLFEKSLACPDETSPISGGCRVNAQSSIEFQMRAIDNYTDGMGHHCRQIHIDAESSYTMTIFVTCMSQ